MGEISRFQPFLVARTQFESVVYSSPNLNAFSLCDVQDSAFSRFGLVWVRV
jgi:hypothetical protein